MVEECELCVYLYLSNCEEGCVSVVGDEAAPDWSRDSRGWES